MSNPTHLHLRRPVPPTRRGRPWRLTVTAAALLCLALGVALAHAGGIPLLGPWLVLASPDLCLAGLVMLCGLLAAALPGPWSLRLLLALAMSMLLALNTRLPTLVRLMSLGPAEQVQVQASLQGRVGDPLRVETSVAVLSARLAPGWAVRPACKDADCLSTEGFRSYQRWNELEYWREDVMQAVQGAGFRPVVGGEAGEAGATAWTLSLSTRQDGERLSVALSLKDGRGSVVARQQSRYLSGWPLETPDAAAPGSAAPPGVLEFLLHANVLNRWVGAHLLSAAAPHPVSAFLARSTQLARAPAATEPEQAAQPVDLELLSERVHAPARRIDDDGRGQRSPWSRLSHDAERTQACDRLLRPDTRADADRTGPWWGFVQDATGRKRVRRPAQALCEPDTVWFVAYEAAPGRTVLSRFTAAGDRLYQISFSNPPSAQGEPGFIMAPSLRAEDGFIRFDWWNGSAQGGAFHVVRELTVRVREPQTQPRTEPAPPAGASQPR